MKFLSRATAISFLFYVFLTSAQSVSAQTIVINEIAWMGTKNSANDEWIELYSNADYDINLSGWKLASQDGTPAINLGGIIPALGFYLLERTDDNTVPNIAADQVYTGALGNSGENLTLRDSTGNAVDSINCSAGWFTGDNTTKQTMERIDSKKSGTNPSNWGLSQNAGGTPKTKNSVAADIKQFSEPATKTNLENESSTTQVIEPEKSEPKVKPENESAAPIEKTTYPSGIIINEVLPSPQGADQEEEWIELFNQNQFDVDLSGWQIKDSVGTIANFTITSGTKIPAAGFLVFKRPVSKIILNNDGDGVSLLRPDGKVAETINYPKAKLNQSWSRLGPDWFWTSQLTPGAKNIIPESAANITGEPSNVSVEKNKIPQPEKSLAAIGKTNLKKNSFIFLIAFIVAAFSGGFIFILKRNLKKI